MKHVNAIDFRYEQHHDICLATSQTNEFSILQRYLETQQLGAQGQNEVNLILNMLNVYVQATPKQ